VPRSVRPSFGRHAKFSAFLPLWLVLAGGAPAQAASAADVVFTVAGVRSADGQVHVALCPEEKFLSEDCPYHATAEAVEGETEVVFTDVLPGVYGIQGYHDANANGELDRNFVGWPLEGFAFGNDPTILFRAPSFEESSFQVGEEAVSATMRMRYR